MSDAWLWWLFIQMLGLACLPLTFSVFANLPDRGWALSKALGVLSLCFLVWFPLSLPSILPGPLAGLALPYARGTILAFLLLLLAVNGWLLHYRWREIAHMARSQTGYIVLGEALFAGAFALLIWIRAFIPDIYGTEKFMDEAFISAILRSPHLPPNDPWLSGYAINYYYFGHFIVATIAKLLGTSPAVAFNTGIALIFALMAVNLFGVTANVATLLRGQRQRRSGLPVRHHLLAAAPYGLAAVLFSLIFGNLFGANEWLAQLGVGLSFESGLVNVLALLLTAGSLAGLLWFLVPLVQRWRSQDAGRLSASRLIGVGVFGVTTIALLPWCVSRIADMAAWLRVAWPQITNWLGHPALWANYDWWNPSRAVHSSPNGYQNITEFPAFSFLLADLHAHVLALPFTVLAIGVALNFLLARGRWLAALGETTGQRALTLVSAAVIIGSLYAMNGWDLPTYAGLALLCLAAQQWRAYGRRFSQALLVSVATLAVSGMLLGLIFYLPFLATFNSPSQGIGLIPPTVANAQGQLVSQPISFGDRTSFTDFWNVFGLFLTIVGGYLLWQLALGLMLRWRRAVQVRQHRLSSALHKTGDDDEVSAATRSKAEEPLDVALSVLTWGLLVGLVVVVFLLFVPYSLVLVICLVGVGICAVLAYRRLPQTGLVFTLMLAGTALALVGFCEVVYLRDVFDHSEYFRMNTIFKLYYQAWTLFAVSGGALLYELLGTGWRISWKHLAPAQRLIEQTVTPRPAGAQAAVSSGPAEMLQGIAASRAASAVSEGATAHLESGTQASAEEVGGSKLPAAEQPSADNGHSYSHEGGGSAESLAGLNERPEPTHGIPPQRHRGGRGDYRSSDSLTPSLRVLGLGGKLVWIGGFLLLVLAALVYPLFATDARTGQYQHQVGLDGAAYIGSLPAQGGPPCDEGLSRGDADAIRWINAHIEGDPIMVEAACQQLASYNDFGGIAVFTGLPTVLGWGYHEYQWRVNWLTNPVNAADFNRRSADLDTIYTSSDAGQVMRLLHHYNASYLYVGSLEHQKYPKADLSRFAQFLTVVYQAEGVTIYHIP
ncbi:MAG TPA: DUF2298 domain-containing protein [Ktedonobacterales bacterium]|nr:DUF2298 domain-containing protein [Ktedonobacterales bacterium]